jgi:hypothetical protein
LARRKPAVCFIGGPKRHIQPERYVQLIPENFGNVLVPPSMAAHKKL